MALLLLLARAGEVPAEAAEGTASAQLVVNINTATLQELQALPGVGATRARAILAARKERGGFKDVAELRHVKGIGERSLERLRPHVRISGKTRVTAAPRR